MTLGASEVPGFAGRVIRGYDTGTRLESYSKSLNVNRHMADIATDVMKRRQRLTDQTITAFTSDPHRFDVNMAAISDLLSDPQLTAEERRKYLVLRDTIIQKVMPGFGVVPEREAAAMKAVTRNIRKVSPTLTVTNSSVAPRSSLAVMPTMSDMRKAGLAPNRSEALDQILMDATRYEGFDTRASAIKTNRGLFADLLDPKMIGGRGPMSGYKPAGLRAPIRKANKALREIPIFKIMEGMGTEIDDMINSDGSLQMQARMNKLYYGSTGINPERAELQLEISRGLSYQSNGSVLEDDVAESIGSVFSKEERSRLLYLKKMKNTEPGIGDKKQLLKNMYAREEYDDIMRIGRGRLPGAGEEWGAAAQEYAFNIRHDDAKFSYSMELAGSPGDTTVIGAKLGQIEDIAQRYQSYIQSGEEEYAAAELKRLNELSADILSNPRALAQFGEDAGKLVASGRYAELPGIANPASVLALVDPDNFAKLNKLGLVTDFERTHRNLFEYENTKTVTDIFGDRDLELFKTPGAMRVAEAYRHLQTMSEAAANGEDPVAKRVITTGLHRLAAEYSGMTNTAPDEAKRILSRTSAAAVKQSMARESTSLWADMTNKLYGGVVIRDAGEAFWEVSDQTLQGQKGFITGVHTSLGGNSRVTVAVRGITGADTKKMWVNVGNMLELGRKANLSATTPEEVKAAMRIMSGAANMVDKDKELSKAVAKLSAGKVMEEVGDFFTKYANHMQHESHVPLHVGVVATSDKLKSFEKLLRLAQKTPDFLASTTSEAKAASLINFFMDRGGPKADVTEMLDMVSSYVQAFKGTTAGQIAIAEVGGSMFSNAVADLAAQSTSTIDASPTLSGRILPEVDELFELVEGMTRGNRKVKEQYEVIKNAKRMMNIVDPDMGELTFKQILTHVMGAGGYSQDKVTKVAEIINDMDLVEATNREGSLDYVVRKVAKALPDAGGRHLGDMMGDVTNSRRIDAELKSTFSNMADTSFPGNASAQTIVSQGVSDKKTFTEIERALRRAGHTDEADDFIGNIFGVFHGATGLSNEGDLRTYLDRITGIEIQGSSVQASLSYDDGGEVLREVGDAYDFNESDAQRIYADDLDQDGIRMGPADDDILHDKVVYADTILEDRPVTSGVYEEVRDRDLERALARGRRSIVDSVSALSGEERTNMLDSMRILRIQDQEIIDAIESGDASVQNYAKNYLIKSMYDNMKQKRLSLDEQKEMSRLMNGVIGFDDIENVTWAPRQMTSSTGHTADYMLAYGTHNETGEGVARAWKVDKNTAYPIGQREASQLIRYETVGVRSVGRAGVASYESAEMMNMALANAGYGDREQMEVMRRLMPDLHADATSKEVLQAIAHVNRPGIEQPEGWMVPVDRAVNAANPLPDRKTMDPFEMVFSNLENPRTPVGSAGHADSTVEALKPAVFRINETIEEMRLGITDDMFNVAENAKEAVHLNPLIGAKKLLDFAHQAPGLTKVAVGMMALGSIGIAKRLSDNAPQRMDEFLQYDHPGSSGINRAPTDSFSSPTRVTKNEGGYSSPGRGRSTPSGVQGPTIESAFRGYNGTITISDNMDSMSPNKVSRMMEGT